VTDSPVPFDSRGRKPSRERHATAIQEAEGKFARNLPDIADDLLDMAMGRREQVCSEHRLPFQCPDCDEVAGPIPTNFQAMKYVMDRIAGTPSPRGEAQVNLAFVAKVAKAVARVFNQVNSNPDPNERARQFAVGITELWATIERDE
jgi:hypothetical protein